MSQSTEYLLSLPPNPLKTLGLFLFVTLAVIAGIGMGVISLAFGYLSLSTLQVPVSVGFAAIVLPIFIAANILITRGSCSAHQALKVLVVFLFLLLLPGFLFLPDARLIGANFVALAALMMALKCLLTPAYIHYVAHQQALMDRARELKAARKKLLRK